MKNIIKKVESFFLYNHDGIDAKRYYSEQELYKIYNEFAIHSLLNIKRM